MAAEAVDLLMQKGKFEPKVALAVAEAVEVKMSQSQFVTVPVLDVRLSELKAGIQAEVTRLDHKIDLFKSDLEKKIDGVKSELEKKIEVAVERLEKLIGVTAERTKAELVRWVFVAMLGSGGLQAAVTAIMNAVQHHH